MKNRRFVFGSTLISVIALILMIPWLLQAHREQQAVNALKSVGAVVEFDFQAKRSKKPKYVPEWLRSFAGDCLFSNVHNVRVFDTPVTDSNLLPLADFPDLRHVLVKGNGVTDHTAHLLSRVPTIESVTFWDTLVTGKGLAEMARCSHLQSLSLLGASVSDGCLQALTEYSRLEHVQVARSRISSHGLESISSIRSLRSIDLWEAGTIDDKGLEHICQLPNLESLQVINAPITDSGLRSCAKMKKLRILRINSPYITDEGLQELPKLSQLESVSFQDSGIQSPGIFSRLPRLTELDLSGSKVSDSTADSISGLVSIRSLFLQRTALTDSSIEVFSPLSSLKVLYVGPDITEHAVRHLHKSLSSCHISIVDRGGSVSFSL